MIYIRIIYYYYAKTIDWWGKGGTIQWTYPVADEAEQKVGGKQQGEVPRTDGIVFAELLSKEQGRVESEAHRI